MTGTELVDEPTLLDACTSRQRRPPCSAPTTPTSRSTHGDARRQALVDVVRDRKLYARISRQRPPDRRGWTTLGGMLGVVPVVDLDAAARDGTGWEARVEARTLDGRVVGAAESMCSRSERRWAKRDEYALRSMAQTRAIGRALRAPLGQIVVLAGYEPAAAEEIPADEPPVPEPDRGKIPPERGPRPSRRRGSASCSSRSPNRTPTSTGSK